jgi:hypothetical protein
MRFAAALTGTRWLRPGMYAAAMAVVAVLLWLLRRQRLRR